MTELAPCCRIWYSTLTHKRGREKGRPSLAFLSFLTLRASSVPRFSMSTGYLPQQVVHEAPELIKELEGATDSTRKARQSFGWRGPTVSRFSTKLGSSPTLRTTKLLLISLVALSKGAQISLSS